MAPAQNIFVAGTRFLHWDLREFPDLDGDGDQCDVPWSFQPAGPPGGLAAIAAAFATWNAAAPSVIDFVNVPVGAGAGLPFDFDGHNLLGFEQVLGPGGDDVWLVGPADQACLAFPGVNVPIIGPGLDQWLTTIPNNCAHCVVLPCDDVIAAGNITAGPDGIVDTFPNWLLPPNVFALTAIFYDLPSGNMFESDILFNDVDWLWVNVPHAAPMVGNPDIETVALHEIGHFFGLHHADYNTGLPANPPGPIMNSGLNPAGAANHILNADDMDGINFLYTPDLGDAPDPFAGVFNEYPSLVHSPVPGRVLNGRQLFLPAQGAEHLFGIFGPSANPRYQYEWLAVEGGAIDDDPLECEARVPNLDFFDDGVTFAAPFIPAGPAVPVTIHVRTAVDVGPNPIGGIPHSHNYVAAMGGTPMYVNGWFDWNADGDWDDPGEHVIGGGPGVAVEPPFSPSLTVLPFLVAAPAGAIAGGYARFRLDWGEDVGTVAFVDPTLVLDLGAAQFGEVEDYYLQFQFCGDGICDPGENCENCPDDCGACPPFCGDGFCDLGENACNCPSDCGGFHIGKPPGTPCDGEYPSDCDDAQIGIQGDFTHQFPLGDCWDLDGNGECDLEDEDADGDGVCDATDCSWAGLAFPFIVEGISVDTVRVSLNTNRSGGDIYITGSAGGDPCGTCPTDVDGSGSTGAFDLAFLLGNWGPIPKDPDPTVVCLDADGNGCIGAFDLAVLLGHWGDCPLNLGAEDCQPDVLDIRRALGCALSGLETNVQHVLHFESLATTPGETLWVVMRGRSGLSGSDGLGFYDGSTFPAHHVGRSDIIPSQPNNSFANLAGTGNVGDWTDLHDLGGGLGTFYCVDLTAEGQDPDTFDCVANPDPVGGCCGLTGVACEEMRGFECGAVGGTYLGDGTTCDDCNSACNNEAGDCCIANGTPGCDDSDCCHYVCDLDPFCCDPKEGEGWTSPCAQEANDTETGCGQLGEVCEPTECVDTTAESIPECIQTGSPDSVEGYLGMVLDEYGAHASGTWSGGNDDCDFGDRFNPEFFDPAEAVFGNALFFYITETEQRVVLSAVPNHEGTYPIDFSAFVEIPEGGTNVASDSNGDGVNDALVSSFAVCGPNDVSLTFDVVQHVGSSRGGSAVSVLTQVYTITNTSGTAIEFDLLRQADYDMFWIPDHANDCVGTETNGSGDDLSVYQMECGEPGTAVTLSSPQANAYWGGKGGVDPDGPEGPDEPFGCGTDFQQWDAYGLPPSWANYIAGVGANLNGDSGPDAGGECAPGGCGCDGSHGLRIPVLLEPGEETCICVQHTYGQRTPWMSGTCPEGCN